jgi:hypothetical protein
MAVTEPAGPAPYQYQVYGLGHEEGLEYAGGVNQVVARRDKNQLVFLTGRRLLAERRDNNGKGDKNDKQGSIGGDDISQPGMIPE